jgi:hypothetical protein
LAPFFVPTVQVGKARPAIHGLKFDEVLAIQASKEEPAFHGRTPQKKHGPMAHAD